jgi:NAD(P)-dependent dehydrogenase (short-subunit alcohol dehydrogenase family)
MKARLRGVRAAHIGGDLADPDVACQLVRWCAQALVPPDILVNSAAVFEPGTLMNTSLEDWGRHLDINLRAPFLTTQSFASFLEDREGKVVNVSDWRAACPGRAYFAYTLSKAGLQTMTEMAARELAPRVQVNAVALGPVVTGPVGVIDAIPAKRAATVHELVDAVLFLLRNDYVTGETLFLDGGAHLLHG